jgi:hypothetical protein
MVLSACYAPPWTWPVDGPGRWEACLSLAACVFQLRKLLPCLAFPAGVCDCEGASRFPWASSLLWGGKTRATGLLGRLSGWPSAVLSLLPPFAAPPLWGGWCPGWGVAPPGGPGLDTIEPPRSTLRKIHGGSKDRREPAAGRATPLTGARNSRVGRQPRAAQASRPSPRSRQGWRSHPYRQER